jgi:hypothetical protein
MKWHTVKIIAQAGAEFGIFEDKDGVLQIITKRPGEEWPHGLTPTAGENYIHEGFTRYVVLCDGLVELLPAKFQGEAE